MSRRRGYEQAKEELLVHIYEHEPTQLHRGEVAAILSIDISTAGNYMRVIAAEYPENLSYDRGILRILSKVPDARISPAAKIKAREDQLQMARTELNKIIKNHLPHENKKKLRGRLADLAKRLE